MKKLFLLILILASNLLAQGWNEIVPTGIIEPNKTDIFTNSAGIHMLVQLNTSSNIVYYNLNSAGVVCTTKTCTLETSGDFPNIVGTNDKIYAIYKTGNNIRVRYSTDNGSSWLTDIADRPTTANSCNGVDAVYEPNYGVHIVWATLDNTNPPGYETYYRRLAPDNSWPEYKNVTDDNAAQYGGDPSVSISVNRVHVSFNTDATTTNYGTGYVKTRDKYNGNWQTSQTVVSGSEYSVDERLLVRGEFLYLFYNCDVSPNDLRFRTRRVDNTQGWSNFTTIDAGPINPSEFAFEIAKTTNDNIHILCKKHIGAPIGWAYTYKYYDGTNWNTLNDFDHSTDNLRQIGLSSVSNDLFCTWVISETSYFKQYDAFPLAPKNLTVSASANNHPLLSWAKNNEADIQNYKVYKYVTSEFGWQFYGTSTTNSFEDLNESYPVKGGSGLTHPVQYRVTSVDYHPYESLPSNTVVTNVSGALMEKINSGELKQSEYSLDQNFPNPFNPSTKISYSLKEEGLVTLKVYDILGKEIATLVNENKPAGIYETEFNASQLPSGMYIYKIQAGSFSNVKKMILTK